MLTDSAEYEARRRSPFKPPKYTISEIRAAIPKELFLKSTATGLYYVARTIVFCAAFFGLSLYIGTSTTYIRQWSHNDMISSAVWLGSWAAYFWWQGIAFACLWCLAHEAGHGTISSQNWINHAVGFSLHTFTLTPYFAWRSTHHAHHKVSGSIERDENYVPRTRHDYGLPLASEARPVDYSEIFEETPLWTIGRLLVMQLVGLQTYFITNALGSPMYPTGTNHFSPSSPLFKPSDRNAIILSDIGLGFMATLLYIFAREYGAVAVLKYYFIPYLLANHWIVMLTYLHHSDPTIPHYRSDEWSFVRGAMATVDRPLLGWIGRYFFHNVSHDHIAHHFFSSIPFYNQPRVTERLKALFKEDYNYDSTNCFRALYRSFTMCCFVEDDGGIVFYKDSKGGSARKLADA